MTNARLTPDQALARTLQSWCDRDPRMWRIDDDCTLCPSSSYLAVITQTRPWPHWMLHTLRERIHELRNDEFHRLLDVYPHGYAHDPAITQVIDDHMATWDLWIADRLRDFGGWERRMLRRWG